MTIVSKANQGKFRKWLELAKQVKSDSPFLKKPTDAYLNEEIARNSDGSYWIYIGKETISVCTKTSNPNLWFVVNDDNTIRMGISFNSNRSVEMAENILQGYSASVKEELLNHLNTDSGWNTLLQIRKKHHTFRDVPEFETRGSPIPINQVDTDKINAIFVQADAIINEYRNRTKLPEENPDYLARGGGVSLNLIEKVFPASEEEFKRAFSYAHDALVICLKIKPPAQYERERKAITEKRYFPFPGRYAPKR